MADGTTRRGFLRGSLGVGTVMLAARAAAADSSADPNSTTVRTTINRVAVDILDRSE